jgi:hypothetical protein
MKTAGPRVIILDAQPDDVLTFRGSPRTHAVVRKLCQSPSERLDEDEDRSEALPPRSRMIA